MLRKESEQQKKKKLVDKYGLIMSEETERRLNDMCNLSDVVLEKGEERLNNLYLKLIENNRLDDLKRAAIDVKYRAILYTEFHLDGKNI